MSDIKAQTEGGSGTPGTPTDCNCERCADLVPVWVSRQLMDDLCEAASALAIHPEELAALVLLAFVTEIEVRPRLVLPLSLRFK